MEKTDLCSCTMKIDNRKAEPQGIAGRQIARTYLDMKASYKRYKVSKVTAQDYECLGQDALCRGLGVHKSGDNSHLAAKREQSCSIQAVWQKYADCSG